LCQGRASQRKRGEHEAEKESQFGSQLVGEHRGIKCLKATQKSIAYICGSPTAGSNPA
jgi:hypothetical protein